MFAAARPRNAIRYCSRARGAIYTIGGFHMNQGSMSPARLLWSPDDNKYRASGRAWQGIPAIERTRGGRLFAAWYSGGTGEMVGNFVVVETSDDGVNWSDAWLIIEHDDPNVRCFDQCLWIDPQGRLWLTWTQSAHGCFDGRDGVWAVICDDPDVRGRLLFSAPRRIANGLMMNKPTALSNGEWLFPCAIWGAEYTQISGGDAHPELAGEVMANVYVTRDNGDTFYRWGGANVPGRVFDEHMVVELKDGRLWMLVRTVYGIGQAYSHDFGRTWVDIGASGHTGPNSRFFIRRLHSGRLLLINHVNPTNAINTRPWRRRDNLMAMLSEDDGRTWIGGLMLDARAEVSYPDATQAEDGNIYAIHDFQRLGAREIVMSVFTEDDIIAGRPVSEGAALGRVINRAGGTINEQMV